MDKTKVTSIIEPVCATHNVELVDVAFMREQGGAVLRLLIDRPGEARIDKKGRRMPGSGVSLADCQQVSRDVSVALDVHEIVPGGRYRLEVSSPGVDRPLTKPSHFAQWTDSEAKITTKLDVDGRRNFTGFLRGTQDDIVILEAGADTFRIPFNNILRANLVYRFD